MVWHVGQQAHWHGGQRAVVTGVSKSGKMLAVKAGGMVWAVKAKWVHTTYAAARAAYAAYGPVWQALQAVK